MLCLNSCNLGAYRYDGIIPYPSQIKTTPCNRFICNIVICWKRRICLAAKRAMIYQAQYALRKHLRDEMPGYDDLSDDDRDIQMNDFDSEYV